MAENDPPRSADASTSGQNKPSSLTDAVKTISLSDFQNIGRMPCARSSLLYGIGSGFGVGGIHYLLRGNLRRACNWSVGAFCLVSIASWELCQSKRRAAAQRIQTIIQQAEETRRRKLERKAAVEQAQDKPESPIYLSSISHPTSALLPRLRLFSFSTRTDVVLFRPFLLDHHALAQSSIQVLDSTRISELIGGGEFSGDYTADPPTSTQEPLTSSRPPTHNLPSDNEDESAHPRKRARTMSKSLPSALNGTPSLSTATPSKSLASTPTPTSAGLLTKLGRAGELFKTEEMVRLMVQALRDLGLNQSATQLEAESGVSLETPAVSTFKRFVLSGDWDDVETAVLEFVDSTDAPQVQLLIRRQKYLELLERRQLKSALGVLQGELTPLLSLNVEAKEGIEKGSNRGLGQETLHTLASYMMCGSGDELRRRAAWDGAKGKSRKALLVELQKYISPTIMVPDRRLEQLLLQATEHQRAQCLYHNAGDEEEDEDEEEEVSLLTDHKCDKARFPCTTLHVLEHHTDEVWYIAFSHDGRQLASASKDQSIVIWSVDDGYLLRELIGHTHEVSFVAWSPNDEMILSCANDGVRLWKLPEAECIRTIQRHTDQVTSCAWLPDGQRFVTAGMDKNLYLWSIDGTMLHRWTTGRIISLAMDPRGEFVVGVCYDRRIRRYNLIDRVEENYIQESEPITSLSLAADGRHVLVNLKSSELHLWDIQDRLLLRTYTGHRQGEFEIRSCFGGHSQRIIASGSEDGAVYLWSRERGALMEVLVGHGGVVNGVAWNPRDARMFASASDDKSVRVWVGERQRPEGKGKGKRKGGPV
ncbi:uncharacterized protein VTP21DRAFT_6140 [Calcarisporiella thermophila]|uniref:uncharacterized protein n=1 Tax=Calcarisporiella thermophila TaxID=911321 RepID=UPI003742F6DE